mmetsp:Transcript_52483/g.87071  ORF Transcript_52483/g.87071 Transcript_52483/m.87071 type:complete len:107 (+) Transcript_52483:52-372(+)
MITFGEKKKNNNTRYLKAVRQWVENTLPQDLADVTVMVNELQCYEPGCAPVETVVTLLDSAKPLAFKIFKPVREVLPEDVYSELKRVLGGGTAPEHQLLAVESEDG